MNGQSPYDPVIAEFQDVAVETKFSSVKEGMDGLLVRFKSKAEAQSYFDESMDWVFCGPKSRKHYIQVDQDDRVLMAEIETSWDYALIWFHGSEDFAPIERATHLFRVIPSEEALSEVSKAMKKYKDHSDLVKIGLYRRTGPTRITT
jgi:hypothetical protein